MTGKKDTVNYTLRDNGKLVYHGISRNLKNRLQQHKASGKKFTSVTHSAPRTRDSARRQETEAIKRYKRNHKGKMPKYNKKL